MKIINYNQISSNLDKIDINTIIVLKDNAYGFGLYSILRLLIEKGFTFFAVTKASEAIKITNLYKNTHVLILGKEKVLNQNNIYITVEDEDDFLFATKHKVYFHLKIRSKMNRFGTDKVKYADSSLCKGIYYHIGENKEKMVLKELRLFETLTKNYKDKIIHIGGSIILNYDTYLIKRIAYRIYSNSLYLYGKIIKIISINMFNSVGYHSSFKALKKTRVGIINIGYNSGLLRDNKGKYVFINDKKYKLIGFKCMDYCFVKIDNSVMVNDRVEFLGDKISLTELAKEEKRNEYELLINLK